MVSASAAAAEALRELGRFGVYRLASSAFGAGSDCVCHCPEVDLRPLAKSLDQCARCGPALWWAYLGIVLAFLLGLLIGTLLAISFFCCWSCERKRSAPRPLANVRQLVDRH